MHEVHVARVQFRQFARPVRSSRLVLVLKALSRSLSISASAEASLTMATSNERPKFGYAVLYVEDVARSAEFYQRAFGFTVRRVDQSHRWGELESGETTIAFTPLHQHETDDLTGTVQKPSGRDRAPLEVCFIYFDVDAAYKKAVENGAVPMSEPEHKEWGQKVGYVRDINGIVVRLGSYVQQSKHA